MVLFEREKEKEKGTHFKFYCEFQSHEPEFDYLKSCLFSFFFSFFLLLFVFVFFGFWFLVWFGLVWFGFFRFCFVLFCFVLFLFLFCFGSFFFVLFFSSPLSLPSLKTTQYTQIVEIEEKINKIRWFPQQWAASHLLLTTNGSLLLVLMLSFCRFSGPFSFLSLSLFLFLFLTFPLNRQNNQTLEGFRTKSQRCR